MKGSLLHTTAALPIVALVIGCSGGGGGGAGGPSGTDVCLNGAPRVLWVQYTGEDCGASDHGQPGDKATCAGDPASSGVVKIIATDKSDPADKDARIWYDGTVKLNAEFPIDATKAGQATLGGRTFVFIEDADGNRLQTVRWNTSCAEPMAIGDQFGSLRITGFVANGNVFEHGKPRVLTMKYNGSSCSASRHRQAADKVHCEGDPRSASKVRIIAADRSDPTHSKARIWFDGEVTMNGEFDIDAANAGQSRLGSETYVFIHDLAGKRLQVVGWHTSGSQPLSVDDRFGSLRLLRFVPED